MKAKLAKLVLGSALAGLTALLLTGCDKPPQTAGAPPPTVSVGTEIDDGVVTTRVKSALLADNDVKSFDFKVDTRKGEVMLSGFVDNQAQLDRALAVVRATDGVKSIDNRTALKGAPSTVGNKVDDLVITTQVKAAMLSDASVRSADITVVTRQGEVQLSGFVDNQVQVERAIVVAQGVQGVARVSNQMSVKQ
jgi:hyperosmotically inducible protein